MTIPFTPSRSFWRPICYWFASISGKEEPCKIPVQNFSLRADLPQFEAFFQRHEPALTAYLWRMLGDMESAHDLCQETFVRAWQHYDTLRIHAQPTRWLYRVATNLALNARRRPSSLSLADFDPATSDPSRHFVERDLVRHVLLELPAKQRALLILREVQQFSHTELAALFDMSPDAVKMALSRARAQFRQRYLRKDQD